MVKILTLLKNGILSVEGLYKLPGASFFLSLSAKIKTFSFTFNGLLSFVFFSI